MPLIKARLMSTLALCYLLACLDGLKAKADVNFSS